MREVPSSHFMISTKDKPGGPNSEVPTVESGVGYCVDFHSLQ